VNSDYSIQKLLEKELIIISGRNEHLPGRPLVYATSQNFMDYFGINSSGDLPEIKEVLADQIVEATVVKPEDFTDWPVAEETNTADLETVPTEESITTEEPTADATQADEAATNQPPAEA
jgi:segregation and condensation protein B